MQSCACAVNLRQRTIPSTTVLGLVLHIADSCLVSRPMVDGLQGDWNNPEGKCHVAIRLETQFSKKTMWRKAIEAGSKSANVKG